MRPSNLALIRHSGLSHLRAHAATLLRVKPAPHRFVIFGQGRTGSSLLVDLLNSHPDIRCESELYNRDTDVFFSAATMRSYAEGRSRVVPEAAYGFKFKVYQLRDQKVADVPGFVHRFHHDGWKIIYLWRENLLRHALSNAVSMLRGTAHLKKGEKLAKSLYPFTMDARVLLEHMDNRAAALREERAILQGIAHLDINYERDLRSPLTRTAALQRTLEFLGMPHYELQTGLQRISAESLREMLANYDEIAAALKARGYEHFLDD